MTGKTINKNDSGKGRKTTTKGEFKEQKGAVEGVRKLETPEERLSRIFRELSNHEPYNEHYSVADVANDELLGIKDPKYVPALLKAMQNPDSTVRAKAVKILGRIGDDSAGPAIFKALDDKSFEVRENAVDALGRLKYKPAVSALIERVKRETLTINESLWAVTALGNIGDKEAVPVLTELTRSKVWCVYGSAALDALGQIGGDAAMEAIFNVLKNPDIDYEMAKRDAAKAFLTAAPYFGDAYDPQNIELIMEIGRVVAAKEARERIARIAQAC